MSTPENVSHTASPVAQDKKGRVSEVGRGSDAKSLLQSSSSVPPLGGSAVKPGGGQTMAARTEVASTSTSLIKSQDPVKLMDRETTGNAGNSSRVGADSGQQLTGVVPFDVTVTGLSRTQIRNRMKKWKKQHRPEAGRGSVAKKRQRSLTSTPSPYSQELPGKKGRNEVLSGESPPPGADDLLTKDVQLESGDETQRKDQPGSYAQAVKAIKLAILKEGFPPLRLSENDSRAK